jgi:DNA-directed RNA polymerase specialized sigma24 family protein
MRWPIAHVARARWKKDRWALRTNVLETRPRTHWLEPIPDVRALPLDVDPAERLALRESIRLAFVSALQHLPAKQRASRYDVDALTSLLRDDAILSMPPYTLWLQGS